MLIAVGVDVWFRRRLRYFLLRLDFRKKHLDHFIPKYKKDNVFKKAKHTANVMV